MIESTRAMTSPSASAARSLSIRVDTARRRIRLRSPLLSPIDPEYRTKLLCRVLACRDVEAVDLNSAIGEAVLRLASPTVTGRSLQETLAELSAGIRGDRASLAPESLPKDCLRRGVVSISRYAGQLSTWRISLDAPGRMRLRHPELRRDRALARSVERVLVAMPGVHRASIGKWWSQVTIDHDPELLEAGPLISILQHMVDTRAAMPLLSSPKKMLASTATLSLAAATDFVLPGLAPLTSLVLVGKNIRTVSRAAGDTMRRHVGMPTVMTAILIGTLATGQFMASGIMAWSYDFWKRRHQRDVESERRLLMEDAAPLPECSALIDTEGHVHVGPVDASHRGSVIQVQAEQMVPLDGYVVDGSAIVDARFPTGRAGVAVLSPGAKIFAGTLVLEGGITIQADRDSHQSRIAGIARTIGRATQLYPGRQAPTARAEKYAEGFAGPTLATAAFGLLTADISAAIAVMRPDYANAEAVSGSLADLDAVSTAIERGCVLKAAGHLDTLAAADTLLLVDHPALWRKRLECRAIPLVDEGQGSPSTAEALRWAASLAHHLADDRGAAVAEAARERGLSLVTMLPERFGDEHGLAVTARVQGHTITLREQHGETNLAEALVLEVDQRPQLRLTFLAGPQLRVSEAIDQLTEACDQIGRKPMRVVLVTSHGGSEAVDRAAAARADTWETAASDAAIAAVIRRRHAAGEKVILAAACSGLPTASRAASVAIDLGGEEVDVMQSPAGIVALAGEIASLADLVIAARQRNERLARSRKISLLPNMACVAGAFFFGFTSLVVAIVSNLGTLGSYTMSTHSLHATRRSFWLRHRMPTRLDHRMLFKPADYQAVSSLHDSPRLAQSQRTDVTENTAHA
jgi:cation transport ATPase